MYHLIPGIPALIQTMVASLLLAMVALVAGPPHFSMAKSTLKLCDKSQLPNEVHVLLQVIHII